MDKIFIKFVKGGGVMTFCTVSQLVQVDKMKHKHKMKHKTVVTLK